MTQNSISSQLLTHPKQINQFVLKLMVSPKFIPEEAVSLSIFSNTQSPREALMKQHMTWCSQLSSSQLLTLGCQNHSHSYSITSFPGQVPFPTRGSFWLKFLTPTLAKGPRLLLAGSRWGIPLVTKVMRKEPQHTQRWDRASGVPPDSLEHLPPKKPESAYFIALCSHLWLYWGLSPTTISLSLSELTYSSN